MKLDDKISISCSTFKLSTTKYFHITWIMQNYFFRWKHTCTNFTQDMFHFTILLFRI